MKRGISYGVVIVIAVGVFLLRERAEEKERAPVVDAVEESVEAQIQGSDSITAGRLDSMARVIKATSDSVAASWLSYLEGLHAEHVTVLSNQKSLSDKLDRLNRMMTVLCRQEVDPRWCR